MTRPFPSMRGAKLGRARLCLAGPRVRAQVSVNALEPGLARAEPEIDAQVSAPASSPAPPSPPAAAADAAAAPTADSNAADLSAPVPPTEASASPKEDASADEGNTEAVSSPTPPSAAETASVEDTAGGGAASRSNPSREDRDVEYISPEDFPYQVGDVVTGRVVFANARGARVAIHGCANVLGYVLV